MRTSDRPSIVGTSTFDPASLRSPSPAPLHTNRFLAVRKRDAPSHRREDTNPQLARPSFPRCLCRERARAIRSRSRRNAHVDRLGATNPAFAAARLAIVRSFPVPPQRVHGTLKRILPAACWIVPVPPHAVHVCGEPIAPVPWHVSHVSMRVTCSFFTAPRTASQKSISIWYSRSPPGSCSTSISPPRPPPRKNWLKSRESLRRRGAATTDPGATAAARVKIESAKIEIHARALRIVPGGGPPA